MKHEALSRAVIGAAMEVLNTLKPGLDEKLYERALSIELSERGHIVSTQEQFPVSYKGQAIGKLVPDLIIDETLIVDTKVVSAFNENHFSQMLGYLAITNLDIGLLVNFKHAKLEWKRLVK
jgi:GxxExxY protein